jgi:hypothetical protein
MISKPETFFFIYFKSLNLWAREAPLHYDYFWTKKIFFRWKAMIEVDTNVANIS